MRNANKASSATLGSLHPKTSTYPQMSAMRLSSMPLNWKGKSVECCIWSTSTRFFFGWNGNYNEFGSSALHMMNGTDVQSGVFLSVVCSVRWDLNSRWGAHVIFHFTYPRQCLDEARKFEEIQRCDDGDYHDYQDYQKCNIRWRVALETD